MQKSSGTACRYNLLLNNAFAASMASAVVKGCITVKKDFLITWIKAFVLWKGNWYVFMYSLRPDLSTLGS